MMKKFLLIFSGLALSAVLLYYIADVFSPGSYGHAEIYEFDLSEVRLIEVIQEFKDSNPQFTVPKHLQLPDHKNGPWYVIYFYYQQKNEIVYTWTRPTGQNKTAFALVSVKDEKMVGGWKDINKDLSQAESAIQIERFETLILKEIKERIVRN